MMSTKADRIPNRKRKGVLLLAGTALALSSCAMPPVGGQSPPPAEPDRTTRQQPSPSEEGAGGGSDNTSSAPRSSSGGEEDRSSGDQSAGPCRTSQLDAKLYPNGPGVQGDIGTRAALRVANIGGSPCTINGWGEVAPDGEKGALPTTVAHNRGMDSPEQHTLEPGQGVVKGLIWNNYNISDHCSLPTRLKVFPPGEDEPLLVDWNERNELCDNGSLETGPFDNEQWPGVHVPGAMADS